MLRGNLNKHQSLKASEFPKKSTTLKNYFTINRKINKKLLKTTSFQLKDITNHSMTYQSSHKKSDLSREITYRTR